jgi:cell surface protein SprA
MPIVEQDILKFLMMLKTVSATYSETNGTMLPGYLPRPYILGNNFSPSGGGPTQPGLGFAFGEQGSPINDPYWMYNNNDIRTKAINNRWLSYDSLQTLPFTQSYTQNITGRATIEPVKNFKIEVNVLRNFTQNYSSYFNHASDGTVTASNELQNGSFSISFLAINTAFVPDRSDYSSATFDNFKNYRNQIAWRLSESNPNWATAHPEFQSGADNSGFPRGYSKTSQEVLLPAFLAAYGGQNPGSVRINNPFLDIPMPNWRVTYDGLSKIPELAKIFTSINLTHGYQCTYNANAYNSEINYVSRNGASFDTNAVGDFYSKFDLSQATISEAFTPLIGIDATLKNSLQLRFDIKQSRMISLSFVNSQITEVKSNEIVFGTGYRLKNFIFPISFGGSTKPKNDLVLKLDCSIRRDKTIIRQLADDTNLPVAGVTVVTVKTTADYVINQRFNIQFFISDIINTPYVSTTFPTSNLNVGLTIRFTLSQ